ncbi:MAG: hypothetical protein RLZZ463_110, partial [Bacteroidota bacterium]
MKKAIKILGYTLLILGVLAMGLF